MMNFIKVAYNKLAQWILSFRPKSSISNVVDDDDRDVGC